MRRTCGTAVAVVMAVLVTALAAVAPGPVESAGAASGYDFSAVDDRLIAATDGCAETCNIWFRLVREGPGGPGDDDILVDKRFGPGATPNKQWQTASAGKLMSGVVVMSVVDDGLLSLDDQVEDFFPDYAGTTKGSTTVRQLMSHSAGYPGLDEAGFYGHPCMNDGSTTIQACAAGIMSDVDLVYPPGGGFSYNGLSMQIAGAITEMAAGTSWNELWQDNIATPLGLSAATGWTTDNPAIGGGALPNGSKATIEDYDRVLEMLQHGGNFRGTQVLSPGAVTEAMDNQVDGLPIVWTPYPGSLGYGIGMWVEAEDATGATTRVSSPGVFGTRPFVDLERDYRGIMAMMESGWVSDGIWSDLQPLVEAQIEANPVGTPPPPPTPMPAVTGVSPGAGLVLGGETVTITGTGLSTAYAIHFGTDNLAPSFTVDSDTQITAVAPPRASPSLVNIKVQTTGGLSLVNGSLAFYRYEAVAVPDVDKVAPNAGPAAGGQVVTITGKGFTSATSVEFGVGNPSPSFTVDSATTITAVAPPRAPALVNVFVTAAGGTSPAQNWESWYRYDSTAPPPSVTAVSPANGPSAGGTSVTITGTNLTGATKVEFGNGLPAASFAVVSPTTITAITPPRAPVLVNVFVTTPAGRSPAVNWQTWYAFQ